MALSTSFLLTGVFTGVFAGVFGTSVEAEAETSAVVSLSVLVGVAVVLISADLLLSLSTLADTETERSADFVSSIFAAGETTVALVLISADALPLGFICSFNGDLASFELDFSNLSIFALTLEQ